jgi:predicted MPP superfamily phosphohydrolase
VLAILIGYIYFDLNFTKVQYVDIKSDKLQGEDKLKILQISDFHDNKSIRIRNKILTSIKELKPDIIVLTGDIIDSSMGKFDNVNKFIEEIVKINPNVYFISGNHEWSGGYNIRFTQGLKSRGITILNNTNRVVKINNTEINLCGIDDYYTRSYRLDSAFNGIDGRNFTVLLSHAPDIIFKYKDIPADLILSGHTHGGQVRLPFIGALVAPGQGFFPKYNKGLYKLDNRTLLYIDSGVGTTAVPIRFCNRSQISFITIKK